MLLPLLAGLASGLRSLTPVAVVAWAAYLGALHLGESPLAFLGSRAAVAVFSVLALGELVFDKLPTAPDRTEIAGLVGRLLLGGLAGAAVAASAGSALALGGSLGAAGGLIGAFGGYEARSRIARRTRAPLLTALLEDVIAVAASVAAVALA